MFYLPEGNIRSNSSPANVLVGYHSKPSHKINEAPCENDVEEMTVIPTSLQLPISPLLYAHTKLAPQVVNFFVAFAVSRDLIPLVLRVLRQTEREGREPSFFCPAPEAV